MLFTIPYLRWLICSIFVVYYILMRDAYVFMFEIYEYVGFKYSTDLNRSFWSFTFFFLILFILLFSKHLNSFNWTSAGFILSFITIPILIANEFSDLDIRYFAGHIILILGFIFTINRISPKLRKRKVIAKKHNTFLFHVTILLMLIPFFFTLGFNFNFNVLLLEDIYDIRFASIENANIFTRYFEGWLSRTICPILLIYGVIHKKTLSIAIAFFALLYLYLTAAHKSLFIGFFVIIFFYFIQGYEKKLLYFLLFILAFFLIGKFLPNSDISNLITTIVYYRFLFVPVEVGTHYYDFFNDKYTYWSQSPFNPLIKYPYDVTPPYVIGIEYYNSPTMGANTGIVADGFMNLGLLGTIINVYFFTLIIGIINKCKPDERYFGAIFIFFAAIQNSPLTTTMLSHGLLIAVLLFYYIDLNPLRLEVKV